MKSVYLCLLVLCVTIAVTGCGGSEEGNTVATEGATADDFAKYEADLAAANAEGTYADEGDEDTGNEDTGNEDTN